MVLWVKGLSHYTVICSVCTVNEPLLVYVRGYGSHIVTGGMQECWVRVEDNTPPIQWKSCRELTCPPGGSWSKHKQFKGQPPQIRNPKGLKSRLLEGSKDCPSDKKWPEMKSVSFSSPLGNLDIKEQLSYCTLPPYLSELQQNSLPTRTAGTIACPWQWLSIDPSGQS